MQQPRRILLIRLKSMGDVIFTLPAVHALRANWPDAQITFLVSKEYAPLLKGFKEVNSVIEMDRAQFKGRHPLKILSEALRVVAAMRHSPLELTIDFQGYGETALMTWASGARQRWGTVYRPGRKWAYTLAVPRNIESHPAADFLSLLQQAGVPSPGIKNEFVLPEEAKVEAGEFFAAHGLKHELPVLFIQAITSAPQKNWPLERYLEVAGLWRQSGWQVLFGGGPADRTALEPARAAGYLVSAGVSLLLSAALVNCSSLVLGGDTGLVHLAVAMGKRVVMPIRTLRGGSTHPFQHRDWAIGPGAVELIGSITTQAVIEQCARACAESGLKVTHSLTP